MGKIIIWGVLLLSLMVSPALAASAPSLGTATNFSVLGALSAASSNTTTLSGNLGLSPGLEVSKTGSWVVGGSQYFGPSSLAATAQTDASSAYDNLFHQSSNGLWNGNSSPAPGVWTVGTDVTFAGTLILDGDYNDVWVFQIGQDMTFSGSVTLTGNAQPCNVFWQIGRSATIGLGSTFAGTLIASSGSVTLVSGATVAGRIIVLNVALTTDGNTISGPACLAAPTPTPTPTSTPTSIPTSTSAPTSTPVPGATSTPTPTSTPVPGATSTPTPAPTSTSVPGATSTPTPTSGMILGSTSNSNTENINGVEINYCPPLSNQIVTPRIIESRRINPQSIFIKWGPYSGTNLFNVQYGFEKDKLIYNTDVTGFSTTINALHPNQPIWVQIAARNDCQIGNYGESKLVGGPGLPSTGTKPENIKTMMYFLIGSITTLIFLVRKDRKTY